MFKNHKVKLKNGYKYQITGGKWCTYDRLRSASGLKSPSTDIIISNHGPI
jgi:hypothetical protein